MSSGEWLFLHFTHVEDDLRARQGPYLNIWGQNHRTTFLHTFMERALAHLPQSLVLKPSPEDLHAVSGKIVLVLINSTWVRGRILDTAPNPHGLVMVSCIDLGSVHLVPQGDIRTVHVTSTSFESRFIATRKPLAQKYVLAEVVSPQELWEDDAILYAKGVLVNQSWKAYSLGNHGGATKVRLYTKNMESLSQVMIDYGMGIPDPNEVTMLETSGVSFSSNNFARPVLEANSSAQVAAQTLPARMDQFQPMKHSPAPIASAMYYEVIVTNIEDGVREFSVQLNECEADIQELRRKLDCVELRPMRNPIRGKVYLALSSKQGLLHRCLVTNCYEDKCSVYYFDHGNAELLDSRCIFEMPDELADIEQLACLVSLADSDELEHLNGVAEAFASIVPGKVFKCDVVDEDRPRKVFLYDEMGRNVKDVIISALAPSTSRVSVQIAQSIQTEEKLYITEVLWPGGFFGVLERLPMEDLDQIQAELSKVYGSLNDPPLLYDDFNSHVGDFAVVKLSEGGQYYRVQIYEEFVNETKVCFVDYGNVLKVLKRKVLAPVSALSLFSKQTFGIFCQLTTCVNLRTEKWKELLVNQSIHVEIIKFEIGVYYVRFTKNPMNKPIALSIKAARRPARMEEEANPLAPRSLSPAPLAYPPQAVLANVTKGVEVVYVDNPMDFYCQLTEAIEPLDTLMAQLSKEYADASKPSVLNPKIGTPCVAQLKTTIEDNRWYRGEILALDSQEAEVLFVDYGNKQKSQLSDLKAIEKTFLTLPPQAYHCCLAAIKVQDEWTPEDKTKFEDESMSKHLSATFTQRASDGKYRVQLTHSDDDGGHVQVLNELYGALSKLHLDDQSEH